MTRYAITHETRYDYESDVSLSHQLIRLEPRDTDAQAVRTCALEIEPCPSGKFPASFDSFGNRQRTLLLDTTHHQLIVKAASTVDLDPVLPPEPSLTPSWEDVRNTCLQPNTHEALQAARFAYQSHFTTPDAKLETFARQHFTPNRPILEAAMALNRHIFERFEFDPKASTVDTHPKTTLETGKGVCQDFAHLMLAALRTLRLPARYVSGYLLTRPPDGKEKLVGADASHAWVAIWLAGHGWIDLDPTNGLLPFDEHITLAWGRDYGDVAPIAGIVYGGGKQRLAVSVDVTAI